MPNLRLHQPDLEDAPPPTLAFPSTELRERLVAGRVAGDPLEDAGGDAPRVRPGDGRSARWQTDAPTVLRFPGDQCVSSEQLVEQIEQTLDRMQDRLEKFKRQLDDSFKFPAGGSTDQRQGMPPPPRPAA